MHKGDAVSDTLIMSSVKQYSSPAKKPKRGWRRFKMTRSEITAELSTMIEKKINPNNDPRIYWANPLNIT